MDSVRNDVIFTGHVQGVFFRATTRDLARRFDVTGWVRNEADGSVRCVVEGQASEVERFLAAVRKAMEANIEDVRIDVSQPTGEFEGFSIRS